MHRTTHIPRSETVSPAISALAEAFRDAGAALDGVAVDDLRAYGVPARTLAAHAEAAAAVATRRSVVAICRARKAA